jgi:hypothetical protein
METADRVVFQESVEDTPCFVSTVFLGCNYQFRPGPPILFETMVFSDGAGDVEMERCSTWLEAEAQHKRMVEQVREKYGKPKPKTKPHLRWG